MNSGVVKQAVESANALGLPRAGQPRTVAQAAAELNVAKSTVRKWIAQRRLGHIRLGRAIRVPEAEVTRLMEEGSRPAARG